MLNLKKTAVAVLALGSGAVFAGTMGPVCSAVNVTIPCESSAWNFGGYALYYEPGTDLGFVGTEATAGVVSYVEQKPGYNWGFYLEGSYHFNTGNDFNINWSRVQRSKTIARDFPITFAEGATTAAGATSFDPNWNAVNFEFGQRVDFGDDKSVRFFGGVQYSRIAEDLDHVGTGSFAGGPDTVLFSHDASLNAFGPRAGVELAYGWGNGLGIYATAATSVLVGKHSFSDNYADSDVVNDGVRSASVHAVVPELEATLGLEYTYAMAQGDLTLDAGWQWINYFNASLHDNFDYITGTGNVAYAHDFSLQGPFFGLKWVGNVA